jgi:anaerobic dimethyl sulfoxide reductase subunit B (iron-sulfur subunit)
MQFGFYFDQSRCTGCYACVISCRDWHDITDTSVEIRKIIPLEQGKYPEIKLSYISLSCCHCETPVCREACPVGAISKRDIDGIMVVDQDECLGKDSCKMFCQDTCPYDVPQFGEDDNSKMQMCSMCTDRLADHKNPVCVDACPMRALDFGPMDKLKEKYGKIKEVQGFTHSKETEPSIIFKPRY